MIDRLTQLACLIVGLSIGTFLMDCALLSVSNGYVQGSMADNLPTILFSNHGLDAVRVYDAYGRLATLLPGEVKCVRMQRSYQDATALYLNTIGGGDSATTPRFYPPDSNGWQLELSGLPLRFSAISIQPLDPACQPT